MRRCMGLQKGMRKLLKDVALKHQDKLSRIAENNTKRNAKGETVLEKGDDWNSDLKFSRGEIQTDRKKYRGLVTN